MSGDKKANGLVKSFIDTFKESSPQLFMKCPYTGPFEVSNLKLDKKLLFVYPPGLFRVDIKIIEDGVNQVTLTLSLFAETFNL